MPDLRYIDSGTTSACAENTISNRHHPYCGGNYLRVRGEYISLWEPIETLTELPPRARRILKKQLETYAYQGTTSACAENTSSDSTGSGTPGNYLRVRGEYARGD